MMFGGENSGSCGRALSGSRDVGDVLAQARSTAAESESLSDLADGHGSGQLQVDGNATLLADLVAGVLHARVQRLLFEEMSESIDLATVERALKEIRELMIRYEDLRAAAT